MELIYCLSHVVSRNYAEYLETNNQLLRDHMTGLGIIITVLTIAFTILGIVIPIVNNHRYYNLKKEIEDQQKKFYEDIEKQKIDLTEKIEQANQESYSTASEIYMNLSTITAKIFFTNNQVLPNVIDLTAKTIQCIIKSQDQNSIETGIPVLVKLIYGVLNVKPDICLSIDEEDIQILRQIIMDKMVQNNEETFNLCIKIIDIYNAQKLKSKNSKPESGGDHTGKNSKAELTTGVQADAKQQLLEYVGKLNAEESVRALNALKGFFGEK